MVERCLTTPVSEGEVRRLRIGDVVRISGEMFTARDEAHHRALQWAEEGRDLPMDVEGLPMYHCGPLARKLEVGWRIISAGPTTSTRMEQFESEFLKHFKVPVIIGKGGMGRRTADAMKEHGAIYAAFPGGAGALAAQSIVEVQGVDWLDLGMPEALWHIRVERFGPLVVAIDSHGDNLYEVLQGEFEANVRRIRQTQI